ncbi:MAG: ATP-binding cassette domain-containing protein [Desulfobacteraceae bacterium]|jgi:ABC-type lipoprotein export system ATPase subunit
MATIIEMTDYTLAPRGTGDGIHRFYFSLSEGNVCAIESPNPDDANAFLRAVATLNRPVQGNYRYKGRRIDLKSYEQMLRCKPKIGYIAPDASLISNLTVRQNFLLKRYYFENNLHIDLDDNLRSICDTLGISSKLDKRPAGLNSLEARMAIVIREISKKPQVLLLDRPEEFIGHDKFDILVDIFGDWIAKKKPVVFFSYDRRFIRRYANRKILIANGVLTTTDLKRAVNDRQ